MVRRAGSYLASVFLLALFLFSGLSSACIGEVAGKISFNVSAGSNETLQMQVFNSCANQSIYYATRSQVNAVANVMSPTIIISPTKGVMLPRENIFINITVKVPYNATVGTAWRAGVAVEEASNTTALNGGATLSVGVVKLFTITALPAKPLPLIDYIIAGVAVAAGLGAAGSYYFIRVRRAPKRAAGKKAAKKAKAFRPLPKKEKKMTYAEFKAMESRRRAGGRRPTARARKRTTRKSARRRRR
ncbi:MAG: hypothetical protein KGH57_04255 [Candidatus Micrarchaeota archaeon]|nr:hypothetical protein [Candidatus Micrarchaeota archaeon]